MDINERTSDVKSHGGLQFKVKMMGSRMKRMSFRSMSANRSIQVTMALVTMLILTATMMGF
jgi:hypothetical protein